MYMPKNKKLRVEIIQLHHNIPVAGHEEKQKIIELVTRNYQWLGVIKDIKRYVEGYTIYQRIENQTKILVGKLIVNKVLEKP